MKSTITNNQPGAFNALNWSERSKFLGHTAEAAFEQYAAANHIPFERFGQADASPLNYVAIKAEIRQRPDFLAQPGGVTHFVEVKGTGKDGVVKMKTGSLAVAGWWAKTHPVLFWFYDSAHKLYAQANTQANTQEIREIIKRGGLIPVPFLGDRTMFYPLPAEHFEWLPLSDGQEDARPAKVERIGLKEESSEASTAEECSEQFFARMKAAFDTGGPLEVTNAA